MQRQFRLVISLFFLLSSANILVFVFRNNGFEYVKYSNKNELYPPDPDSSFLQKWNAENKKFSFEELAEGDKILQNNIGLDTIQGEINKIYKTAAWLFESFSSQMGQPEDTLNGMTPLQQYRYLLQNKHKQLWCGQFQGMFGFFISSARLINRYAEVLPGKNAPPDVHEVNEVFLTGTKEWVMVDVSRNRLVSLANDKLLSAANYLDLMQGSEGPVTVMTNDTLVIESGKPDRYFNDNYYLRYYRTMQLPAVYEFKEKLKRYIWEDPWYENYDPLNKHSHLLFHVKQVLFFSWFACLAWLVVILLSKAKRKT